MNSSESELAPLEGAGSPELVVLAGHTAPVESAVFSPDGTLLATSGRDGQVILWECDTGAVRRVWQFAETSRALAFSSDGKTLFTSQLGANAWNVESGRWEGRFAGLQDIVQFSVDGSVLTVVELDRIVRVESDSGRLIREIPLGASQTSSAGAFSHDDSTLAVGTWEDGIDQLRVWDLPSGELKLLRNIPRRLWWKERDPQTGKLRRTHGAQGDVESLALSPNGRLLAVGGTFTLWLCDTRTGWRTRFLACGWRAFRSLAISPNGKLLATGQADGTVTFRRLPSGDPVAVGSTGSNWVSALAFSPSGEWLVSGTHDKQVDLWRASDGARLARLSVLDIKASALTYSPDGAAVAVSYSDDTVRLWDARSGRLARVLSGAQPPIDRLEFSVGGETLRAVGRTATVIWELDTGEVQFLPHPIVAERARCGEFACEGISPNGELLAQSRGWKGRIELRSPTNGELLKTLPEIDEEDGALSLVFSPDSRILAVGYDGFRVRQWEVETGRLIQLWCTHGDSIGSLAFSPDGSFLAVGGCYDVEVILCKLGAVQTPMRKLLTREEQGHRLDVAEFWKLSLEQFSKEDVSLCGHTGGIRGVAYSPDGRTVATVATDGALKLWDPVDGRLRATLLPLPSPTPEASAEWLAYTPGGYYAASEGGHGYVGWRVDGDLLPGSAFAASRHDPERVAQALATMHPE